jgi:hypothetical protein
VGSEKGLEVHCEGIAACAAPCARRVSTRGPAEAACIARGHAPACTVCPDSDGNAVLVFSWRGPQVCVQLDRDILPGPTSAFSKHVSAFLGSQGCARLPGGTQHELCVCVCVCMCARMRVCVRACVRACARAHVHGRLRVCIEECSKQSNDPRFMGAHHASLASALQDLPGHAPSGAHGLWRCACSYLLCDMPGLGKAGQDGRCAACVLVRTPRCAPLLGLANTIVCVWQPVICTSGDHRLPHASGATGDMALFNSVVHCSNPSLSHQCSGSLLARAT